MKLDKVQVAHFRNLSKVHLSPSPDINFFFGQNGSGKSSLLEALHFLGYGRSFRTARHKRVIQHQQQQFSIFGLCTSDDSKKIKLGIQRGVDDSVTVSINGEHYSKISHLVSLLPVQIFTPQSSDIILGSPNLRRKFVDWGVFHVEQKFGFVTNSYRRLLSQKNALLKSSNQSHYKTINDQSVNADYWTDTLVSQGETLTRYREAYLEALKPQIIANLAQFLPEFCVEISYHRGWEKDLSFAEAIDKKAEKDSRFGFLSVGPHKADIRLRVDGIDAAEVCSRGQLRMLVAAMQLAQTQYLNEHNGKTCVFLLDDVGAELDADKREVFIDELLACEAQLFITAIERAQVPFLKKYKNSKLFHVEHGQVNEEN